MRASARFRSAQAESPQPAAAVVCSEPSGLFWSPSLSVLSVASFAALLLCVVDASAVRSNTPRSAAIGYICHSLALLGCAAVFWTYARSATGLLRLRWSTMVAALMAASVGFAQCFPDVFGINTPTLRPYQLISFNLGDALYILAIVLFFSGIARSIVVLDMLQALLVVVLRFSLTYSSTTVTHFSSNHLLISQLVALFMFLTALIAGLGAVSPSERKFLHLLSWFFGLRFVGFFLSDQVSYIWLHNTYCSIWDMPGTALLTGFGLYLLYARSKVQSAVPERTKVRQPTLVVRSLMPSFLALVNLMLGLFALELSLPVATLAISLTVILYVARTALLQAHAAHESALLQSRNEQLEGLVTRDPLTGLGNRRSLAAVYAHMQVSANSKGLALLFMDIDYFKRANDLLGHLYGDKVLVALADTLERIAARVPASHCARFGGDEFALLLPAVSEQDAHRIAEEIRSSFAAHEFQIGEGTVSISMGVHLLSSARDVSLEALISYADAALYRDKMQGRIGVDIPSSLEQDAALETPSTPQHLNLQPAS